MFFGLPLDCFPIGSRCSSIDDSLTYDSLKQVLK